MGQGLLPAGPGIARIVARGPACASGRCGRCRCPGPVARPGRPGRGWRRPLGPRRCGYRRGRRADSWPDVPRTGTASRMLARTRTPCMRGGVDGCTCWSPTRSRRRGWSGSSPSVCVAGVWRRWVRELNERGVPCPSSADPGRNGHRLRERWIVRTVVMILENPRYTTGRCGTGRAPRDMAPVGASAAAVQARCGGTRRKSGRSPST
jgi:hypothetical protein